MECMKCGRETDQTFCGQCRETMKKYPVKPNTVVTIPQRPKTPAAKKQLSWHQQPLEEQIAHLKLRIKRLTSWIVVLVILLGFACGAAVYFAGQDKQPVRGQNYSAVTQPTTE